MSGVSKYIASSRYRALGNSVPAGKPQAFVSDYEWGALDRNNQTRRKPSSDFKWE